MHPLGRTKRSPVFVPAHPRAQTGPSFYHSSPKEPHTERTPTWRSDGGLLVCTSGGRNPPPVGGCGPGDGETLAPVVALVVALAALALGVGLAGEMEWVGDCTEAGRGEGGGGGRRKRAKAVPC